MTDLEIIVKMMDDPEKWYDIEMLNTSHYRMNKLVKNKMLEVKVDTIFNEWYWIHNSLYRLVQ